MATVRLTLTPGEADFLASAFPQYLKTNGTNIPVAGLAYDATADEAAFWRIAAENYGSGNLTATIEWYADTASSGTVAWEVQIAAITPNTDTQDIETDALATVQRSSDTHLGTTGQRLHSHDVTISNLDSLAAGDDLVIRIARDADDTGGGGDTMTGDAILTKVRLSWSDT